MGSADEYEAVQRPSSLEEERILVSVRMRPLNEKEAARKEVIDWECINNTTIIYKNHHLSPERAMYPSSYTFDRVFSCDCSTRQVYEEGAKAVVLSSLSGINSSVFAYGQTSSGKTFTMSGITEYTMEDIFDYIKKHKEREFQLKFSAMEIYNESVRDLLTADNSPLRLLDDPERGTVVEKLTEETLRDWSHFKELLTVCEAQRQIGETFLNEASSRSHQILRLTIESSTHEFLGNKNFSTLTATLNFVDLAGSERASQALSAGSRLKEGSHINRSLLTLGTVIRKLSKGRTGHIPYRDSKLTRILQSSVGGNARTAIICTMSPARSYVEQSRNTLLFASCAKEVTISAHVNVVMSDKALVKHLQRELARMESELRSVSPSVRADATNLLKEKDFQIEELETEVRKLTLQLDLALSQIHDLQQGAGDRTPIIWEREDSSYHASEGSVSDTAAIPDFQRFENPQSPDRHSRLSYEDNYSSSDLEESIPPCSPFEKRLTEIPSNASPSILTQTPNIVEGKFHQVPKGCGEQGSKMLDEDSYILSEEIAKQTPNSSEEIEGKRSLTFEKHLQQGFDRHGAQSRYAVETDSYQISSGIEEQAPNSIEMHQSQVSESIADKNPNYDKMDMVQTLEAIRDQDDECLESYRKELQCIECEMNGLLLLPPKEEGHSLLSMGHENDHKDHEVKQESELNNMILSSLQDSKEPFGGLKIEDEPECKKLNSKESRSCQSYTTSSASLEKVNCEKKKEPIDGYPKFVVRSEDINRKLSALRYDTDNEISQISGGDVELDENLTIDVKVSNDIDETMNCTSVMETEKMTKSQCMKQLVDCQAEDTMQKGNRCIKNMKDVGLSPQDDLDTMSPWPSDFKRHQREIIDLWDICSVSLVHRTYFFLLFIKSCPTDTIYMEVERRRLSFLEDAFSKGNSILLDGQEVTSHSSLRSLHKERRMLSRLMKRRFSSQERKDLYIKWGININSKKRSLQLTSRLWVDTMNTDHIVESADVVAKLVRFSEPQVPSEAFGLNLGTTQGRRKSFGWKHNPSLFM